ncbi:TonB family protein [Sphingomonas sp. LaA6.9]|uniref:TonB family protein n=1 Tax=Sphingomonas sp. LaA6.9 TaxID=2919914 RepID=UPI001F4F25D0|nr:TonB family protein [Sphingomonas sp. LaA6.9]MCJ8157656.1 energy transducer TonB [Sphingomonas sp. LaA6.9]
MTFWAAITLVLTLVGAPRAEADPATDPEWIEVAIADGIELRFLPPWVTDADYPTHARLEDAEGTSVLRLNVAASGQIISCIPVQSSGSLDLDERACLLYRQRARFELRGTAKPITLHAPMVWRLEEPPVHAK